MNRKIDLDDKIGKKRKNNNNNKRDERHFNYYRGIEYLYARKRLNNILQRDGKGIIKGFEIRI